MSRSKTDEMMTCGLRLSSEEMTAVDALAQARGVSRSELLRKMVQRVLAAEETKKNRTQVTPRFKKSKDKD